MRTWSGIAALLAVTLFVASCATNPATGKKEFSLVSQSQEIQIGQEQNGLVEQELGFYEDANVTAYVNRVGQKLATVTELPSLTWHFHVIDSPDVNAFALPGGYIYVTRGILAVLNSEAQLAGVVGHEEGHVTARHTAQMLTRQQVANLGLGVGSILSSDVRRVAGVAGTGLQLLFLKFSRANETQADELAVRYSARASYDARQIPPTYAALKALAQKSGSSTPGFLSTHPDPGNREVTTRALANQAVAGKDVATLRVAEAEYKRALDGIVYGDDPRQGFFENGVFYHPQLRFQVTFPNGWKTQNTRAAVLAARSDQQAVVQMSVVPAQGATSPSQYVSALQQKGTIAGANGSSERISGWPAWLGTVQVQAQDGTSTSLYLGLVQRESGTFYQFLGAPAGAVQSEFISTARSLRTLSDPSKLNRLPARLALVTVPRSGMSVEKVASTVPGLAVPVDEIAFLNNLDRSDLLDKGFVLKVVQKAGTP
jgi:predicted Zn-dependent protease